MSEYFTIGKVHQNKNEILPISPSAVLVVSAVKKIIIVMSLMESKDAKIHHDGKTVMTPKEIIAHRLSNQQIVETKFSKPEEMVSWFGAMQSQDWYMALWAVGLRLPDTHAQDVVNAFNEGRILRTHILRPTWHFVSPADIKWIQKLTAPRVHILNSLYYRKFDLDAKTLRKAYDFMVKTLQDKNYTTREELNILFSKNKIVADRLKLGYIMMHAELEGLICSGPRQGKQFTYALLDEQAPKPKTMTKDEALHELTSRYFTSRGPATIKDFTWWSGLTVKDAKEGIASLNKKFEKEAIGGQEYVFHTNPIKDSRKLHSTFLIPDYDEYGISYKDRSIYNNPKMKGDKLLHADYYHAIAVDGFHGGNWKKTMKGEKHVVEVSPFNSLTKTQLKEVERAVKKYQEFFS